MVLTHIPANRDLWVQAHKSVVNTDMSPFDGLWHFLCVSYIAANNSAHVWVDVTGMNDTFRVGSSTADPLAGGGCLMLGQLSVATDSDCTNFQKGYSFEGYLAEVSLWSKVLTVDEASGWHCMLLVAANPPFMLAPCPLLRCPS